MAAMTNQHAVEVINNKLILHDPTASAEEIHAALAAATVPTLGEIAEQLQKWKDVGVTIESLNYAAERVWI